LNTVNSLHSFIKDLYAHYRGVATEYINRYNALFSIAFRCAGGQTDTFFVHYAISETVAIGMVHRILKITIS